MTALRDTYHRVMRLVVVAMFALFGIAAQAQERRLALLIGNEAYGTPGLSTLENPHEDVDRVRGALLRAGFRDGDIVVLKDRNRAQTIRAIGDFSERLNTAGSENVGFFYYSGHGGSAERDGRRDNFIVPVREEIEWADDLESFGVSLPAQLDKLQRSGAGSVFVVIDACRNTLSWRGTMAGAVTKGIAREDFNPTGLMLLFAAGDGGFADDDPVFSTVLSEEIVRGGQDALRAFSRVSQRVGQQKGYGTKTPTLIPALRRDVCFVSCEAAQDSDASAWALASELNTREAYQGYLYFYPQGRFAADARAALVRIAPELPPAPRAVGSVFRDPFTSGTGQGPELVVLPRGSFVMGSPDTEKGRDTDEGPLRTVRIDYTLAVGRYEVTWAEWEACVADGECDNAPVIAAGGDEGWRTGRRPVINVSWDDAQAYVTWLNGKTGLTGRPDRYRLLSEAEWEYAARGVTSPTAPSTPFYTGATISTDQANYNGNYTYGSGRKGVYREKTVEAGSFAPNPFGLYDMSGNVWEWVEDCYENTYSGKPTDGSAFTKSSCSSRVFRGGSWLYYPLGLRSAYRFRSSPDYRVSNLGFRLTRTLSR